MEDFVNYLEKEYHLPSDVVCNRVSFNHSTKTKLDKPTNRPITNNIIGIKLECFDKDHKLIISRNEKFIDGQIYRPKTKKPTNISPDELNNKLGVAKSHICSQILGELEEKQKEINGKIEELKAYCGNIHSIIPQEFINEPKVTAVEDEAKNKHFEF